MSSIKFKICVSDIDPQDYDDVEKNIMELDMLELKALFSGEKWKTYHPQIETRDETTSIYDISFIFNNILTIDDVTMIYTFFLSKYYEFFTIKIIEFIIKYPNGKKDDKGNIKYNGIVIKKNEIITSESNEKSYN